MSHFRPCLLAIKYITYWGILIIFPKKTGSIDVLFCCHAQDNIQQQHQRRTSPIQILSCVCWAAPQTPNRHCWGMVGRVVLVVSSHEHTSFISNAIVSLLSSHCRAIALSAARRLDTIELDMESLAIIKPRNGSWTGSSVRFSGFLARRVPPSARTTQPPRC